jgi:fluoride exporter
VIGIARFRRRTVGPVSTRSDHPSSSDPADPPGPDPATVDPDAVPAGRPAQPRLSAVVAVVAIGGIVGAEARYGLSVGLPHAPGAWAWSTLFANVTGCLLIGVLMVLVAERIRHPLVRPLLGVGVLGGYTTFSTYTTDTLAAFGAGHVGPALLYLALTPVLAVAAAAAGAAGTRALLPGPA